MKSLIRAAFVALAFSLLTVIGAAQAQEAVPPTLIGYSLAPDSSGVAQVYQLLLDGQQSPRQITFAAADVEVFSASYDGLAVVYISAATLWLQPIHTQEPVALAQLSADATPASPVWSPDGQYLAYADHGIWLMDLGTRQPRLLLKDSASAQYQPQQFLLGAVDKVPDLIVDIVVGQASATGITTTITP